MFFVGLLNTLLVASLGVVCATLVGFILGVLRLSTNWLVNRLAYVYVEAIRNVPVLLQIVFWYGVFLGLPRVRQSINVGDILYLNNRGLQVPWPIFEPGIEAVAAALGLALAGSLALRHWAKRRQQATGRQFPVLTVSAAVIIVLPLLAAAAAGFPVSWDIPQLKGFNFAGGVTVKPEFAALWTALTAYTAAFIGEIVRAGILAVSKGQTEAASSLGLRPNLTMRLIILPQALRVIVPPLTSQHLNLIKNSSLATAIGYPDLVATFAGTTLNQTGQAVEVIAMTMAVYLTISLLISLFMNWYNKKTALVER